VYAETKRLLATYKLLPTRVIDVGSFDVNGSYRELFRGCDYTGVDISEGPNVDLVMPSEFELPVQDASVGLVLCGSCLEHCRNPHRLVEEFFRVLQDGGVVLLNAPAVWPEHRYPLDCFRFLPDGMAAMLELSGFHVLETYSRTWRHGYVDCYGVGRKCEMDDSGNVIATKHLTGY
jgi:SAM-dependent methyltransferase